MMLQHFSIWRTVWSLQLAGVMLFLFSCQGLELLGQEKPLGTLVVDEGQSLIQKEQIIKNGMLPDGRIIVQANHSEQERKIFEVLEEQTMFDFRQTPIEDVIDYFSTLHNIPILINNVALKSSGLSTEFEVGFVVEKAQLKKGLRSLLKPYGLDYVVRNDVLEITTIGEVSAHMETRVYNVRPLRVTEPDALADVLVHTTGKTAWEETGIGGLSYFNGSFVIKQNQETHEEIEAVLNQLANDIQHSAESPEWGIRDRSRTQILQRTPKGTGSSGQGFF